MRTTVTTFGGAFLIDSINLLALSMQKNLPGGRCELMRTDANQCELPFDAPVSEVLAVRSEADAVRKCLRLALRRYGRDQLTIALACGWKTDSCLSEIASETNKRRMPEARLLRFALATGCNLVLQYRDRIEAEARNKGHFIHREEADRAADACLLAWGIAA